MTFRALALIGVLACAREAPVPAPQPVTPYLALMAPGLMPLAEAARIERLYNEVSECTNRRDVPIQHLRFVLIRGDTIPHWLVNYEGPAVRGAASGNFLFIGASSWACDSCLRHELTHNATASEDTRAHPDKYFNAKCRNVW